MHNYGSGLILGNAVDSYPDSSVRCRESTIHSHVCSSIERFFLAKLSIELASRFMNINMTNNRQILLVFCFFLIVNFISSGGHLDMWDGVVTFMITESMALKHTAQLDPEIPTISGANETSRVHLMMSHEIGHNKYVTGGYSEWLSKSMPIEAVFTSRSLLLPTVAVPFYYLAHILSLNAVTIVALSVNSLLISLTALVIFCFSLDLYGSRRIAFALGVIFTGCSFILPYNNSLFPQPLQALCLITGFFFLYKSRHDGHSFLCNLTRYEAFNDKQGLIYSGLASIFLRYVHFREPHKRLIHSRFCNQFNHLPSIQQEADSMFFRRIELVTCFSGSCKLPEIWFLHGVWLWWRFWSLFIQHWMDRSGRFMAKSWKEPNPVLSARSPFTNRTEIHVPTR